MLHRMLAGLKLPCFSCSCFAVSDVMAPQATGRLRSDQQKPKKKLNLHMCRDLSLLITWPSGWQQPRPCNEDSTWKMCCYPNEIATCCVKLEGGKAMKWNNPRNEADSSEGTAINNQLLHAVVALAQWIHHRDKDNDQGDGIEQPGRCNQKSTRKLCRNPSETTTCAKAAKTKSMHQKST